MRRTAFALALLLVPAGALPSQAQWWGPGWRPCPGFCRPWGAGGPPPARFWAPGDVPWRLGPARLRPIGPWWNPRAVRWRRFAAWRRRAEAADGPDGAPPSSFGGWVWRVRPPPADRVPPAPEAAPRFAPHRSDQAVATLPPEASRPLERQPRAVIPARVLATAAMMRRGPAVPPPPFVRAVVRVPGPPARPVEEPRTTAAIPHRPRAPDAVRPPIRPAVLRSQPAVPRPAPASAPGPAAPVPPAPPPQAPSPAPADVPVAPLD